MCQTKLVAPLFGNILKTWVNHIEKCDTGIHKRKLHCYTQTPTCIYPFTKIYSYKYKSK